MSSLYKDPKSDNWGISIQVPVSRGSNKMRRMRKSLGTPNRKMAEDIQKKLDIAVLEKRWFDIQPEAPAHDLEALFQKYETDYVPKLQSARAVRAALKVMRETFQKLYKTPTPPLPSTEYIIEAKKIWFSEGKAPATINRYLSALKKAFNYAIDVLDWDIKNPVKKSLTEIENNIRERVMSLDEEQRFYAYGKPLINDIVGIALSTGLREGKLLSLMEHEIDFHTETATSIKDKVRWDRKHLTPPMKIPLNKTALEIFKRRIEINRAEGTSGGLIFHTKTGKKILLSSVWYMFHAACRRAKIEGLTFHGLRHTFNTRMEEMGVSQEGRMRLMGQKTMRINSRYSHGSVETYRPGVEAVEEWKRSRAEFGQNEIGRVPNLLESKVECQV